jgi:hypothetical protein
METKYKGKRSRPVLENSKYEVVVNNHNNYYSKKEQ